MHKHSLLLLNSITSCCKTTQSSLRKAPHRIAHNVHAKAQINQARASRTIAPIKWHQLCICHIFHTHIMCRGAFVPRFSSRHAQNNAVRLFTKYSEHDSSRGPNLFSVGGCLCTEASTRLLTLVPPDEAQLQKQFGSARSSPLLGRLGGDTSNKARTVSLSF
jgi:hypothetical protein